MASKRLAHGVTGNPSACGTGIGDLSSELLNVIFHKLGPSPVHIAALPSVCKAWRGVMQEFVWPQLCLEIAPGLCERLGYDVTSEPPGGWLALFKLLLYCPGMRLPNRYVDKNGEEGGFLELMGHVQRKVCGFQTGPAVAKDLLLKEPFRQDCLFVTRLCRHAWLDDERKLAVCACRGMVRNFPDSAIAKDSAAVEYVEASPQEQQLMREAAERRCAYCGAPVSELHEDVFFNIKQSFRDCWSSLFDDDPRRLPDWFDVTGQVCGNGHLTFEVFGKRSKRSPFLSGKPLVGSGQGLVVEISGLIKKVCKELLPEHHGFCEIKVCEDLNPYTLSGKLMRLATEIRGFDLFDGCEEGEDVAVPEECGTVEDFNTMADVIQWIPRLATRIDEIIQMYNDSRVGIYKDSSDEDNLDRSCESSDLESESEEEEEVDEELPFWSVSDADLEAVKKLRDTSVTGRAAETIGGYLCNNESSAKIVVNANIRLDRLFAFRDWAEGRLKQFEREREREIEIALKEAGLQRCGGKWPLPDAILTYIKDPNVSLEEAVNRQWQCVLEAPEERRAAERAQQERAEQEAKDAERKIKRERLQEVAGRVFGASPGLVVCRGSSEGTSCSSLGSEACAHSACGSCCCTCTRGPVCKRHSRSVKIVNR